MIWHKLYVYYMNKYFFLFCYLNVQLILQIHKTLSEELATHESTLGTSEAEQREKDRVYVLFNNFTTSTMESNTKFEILISNPKH